MGTQDGKRPPIVCGGSFTKLDENSINYQLLIFLLAFKKIKDILGGENYLYRGIKLTKQGEV